MFTHNGTKATGKSPFELAEDFERRGVGEIVLNNIDTEGTMKGFDFKLIDGVREIISKPMTVLGGAGDAEDIKKVIHKYKIIGVAAGSLFVFKGKYRAVLINYTPYNSLFNL